MIASAWHPVSGIEGPCADISFARRQGEDLVITMHFSLVIGLPNRDLRLLFRGALAMHWEDEFPGLFPLPTILARCSDPRWKKWAEPLHKVEGSTLLAEHRGMRPTAAPPRIAHFLLISMNDLVHVVAQEDVAAEWVQGVGETEAEAKA